MTLEFLPSPLSEPLHFAFMQKALVACVLIGFTNGFLSAYIVFKRLALMADALSHSLLPGLALGAIFFGLAPTGLFIGAALAALLVGLGSQVLARSCRLKEETALGGVYVVAFAIGIALLKYSSVHIDLAHFLFGNILGLSSEDLWITYTLSAVTLLTLTLLQRPLLLAVFQPDVAQTLGVPVRALNYLLIGLIVLCMVSSLQAVGVVLSLGLLILPGATMYLWVDSSHAMTWGGGLLGLVGAVAGLFISYWANLPSGPAIVLVHGAVFIFSYLFAPRYGVLFAHRKRRAQPSGTAADG